MEKQSHKVLKEIEANKLRIKGFMVEFERKLDGIGKVDIFAKKGEEIIIVECGYLEGLTRDFIKERFGKFLWIPYIRLWCHRDYPRPPEKPFIPIDVMKMGETLGQKG